jgi:hypothetical protein
MSLSRFHSAQASPTAGYDTARCSLLLVLVIVIDLQSRPVLLVTG